MTYERFSPDELILRDHLAVDRTALANERTLLAYVRTSLTLLIAGITFVQVKLLQSTILATVGWIFLPLGAIILLYGISRYFALRRKLRRLQEAQESEGRKTTDGGKA